MRKELYQTVLKKELGGVFLISDEKFSTPNSDGQTLKTFLREMPPFTQLKVTLSYKDKYIRFSDVDVGQYFETEEERFCQKILVGKAVGKEIKEKGFSLDNSHGIEAGAQVIEAITNIPISRALKKTENIQGALDEQNENWQRVMMGAGWSGWGLGVDMDHDEEVLGPVKKKKKKKQKKGFVGF